MKVPQMPFLRSLSADVDYENLTNILKFKDFNDGEFLYVSHARVVRLSSSGTISYSLPLGASGGDGSGYTPSSTHST